MTINSHSEFTVEYDTDRFGVPSPLEQSRRHMQVLLDCLDIGGRADTVLPFQHLVMFHPELVID